LISLAFFGGRIVKQLTSLETEMRKLAIVFASGLLVVAGVGSRAWGQTPPEGGDKPAEPATPSEPAEPETPESVEPAEPEGAEPVTPGEGGGPVVPGEGPVTPRVTKPGDKPPEAGKEKGVSKGDREYWKDIKVVSRKLILKQRRVEVNLYPLGMTINDNLIRHWYFGGDVSYFLSDAMSVGLGGHYYVPDVTQRAYLMGLQQRVLPTLNKYHFTATANFNYNWMYGKFALHNWFIQQFGGYVGAGVGVTMTSVIPRRAGDSSWNNYNFTIMFPSFGIRMFVFKWLTINLGLRLYIMRDVFEASNRPPDDDPNLPSDYNPKDDSQAPRWVPNLTFNLGVSFFLPPSFKYTTFK
jgi:outer membrane beta-barrel protein